MQTIERIRVLIENEIMVLQVADEYGISTDAEAEEVAANIPKNMPKNLKKQVMKSLVFRRDFFEENARKGLYKIIPNQKDMRAG